MPVSRMFRRRNAGASALTVRCELYATARGTVPNPVL